MERRLWGFFTGTHLTIMFTAAILAAVPTALWSVDAFNNVAVEDPVTGNKVAVDAARRMFVYDQIGDTAVTPANLVHVFANVLSCNTVYTIPAGKAFILKSVHAYLSKASLATATVEVDVYPAANCGGGLIARATSGLATETKILDFGGGIPIPAGHVISVAGINQFGTMSLYGYLVPAAWVP